MVLSELYTFAIVLEGVIRNCVFVVVLEIDVVSVARDVVRDACQFVVSVLYVRLRTASVLMMTSNTDTIEFRNKRH